MQFKKVVLVIFIFGCSLSVLADTAGPGEWEKADDKDGIEIYTREIKGSSIKEFKGVGVIEAPLTAVNTALDDIPRLAEWMPNCKESRIVEKVSANHLVLYQVLDMPFPFSDRDYTFETVITKTPGQIERTVQAVSHPAVPEKRKLVRITEMDGEWVLKACGPNKEHTLAEYRIKTNPAGNIPASLANSGSVDIPYQTIKRLAEQAPRYQ